MKLPSSGWSTTLTGIPRARPAAATCVVCLGVVGGCNGQIGIIQITVPVTACKVFYAPFITQRGQIGAKFWCDDLEMRARAQQQGDLAGRDLAAADHDAELILYGQENR